MSFSVPAYTQEHNEDSLPPTLLTTFRHQALLPGDERQRAALRRIHYELDLPADERQRAVLDRLRAWLVLDREEASRLAQAFEAACRELPSEDLADVRDAHRDAMFNGLTFHEFERLTALLPSLGDWLQPERRGLAAVTSPYAFIAAALCGVSA